MRGSTALLQRRQFPMAKIRILISGKMKNEKKNAQTWRTAYAGESVLHLCTKFEADCSSRSKDIKGVPKLGYVTPATSTHGSFMIHTQAGSVFYVCT